MRWVAAVKHPQHVAPGQSQGVDASRLVRTDPYDFCVAPELRERRQRSESPCWRSESRAGELTGDGDPAGCALGLEDVDPHMRGARRPSEGEAGGAGEQLR